MTDKIKCPVCKRELKVINMNHINSKNHQDALKKKGIDPDEDPALALIPETSDEKDDEVKEKKEEKEMDTLGKKEENEIPKIEEELDFGAPDIPPPPKMNLTFEMSSLSMDVLTKIKELETEDVKVVLSRCRRCDEVIPVPVPKHLVLNSDLPVVPVSYIHKNPNNEDIHCITLHMDHDFDIRRQKISDVIFGDNVQ